MGRMTTKGRVTDYTNRAFFDITAITAGPDGALWFTNELDNEIVRMTTAGTVTNVYTGPGIVAPTAITVGPDGALWFVNGGFGKHPGIGRITTSGTVTDYTKRVGHPFDITAGPDGALWFSTNNAIGRITTAGKVTNTYTGTGIVAPESITTGPDGALWFTGDQDGSYLIGRITTACVVTTYTNPRVVGPAQIISLPHGPLWFLNDGEPFESFRSSVGRITTAGKISIFTGMDHPAALTAGPDGNLWFANLGNNTIGRMTDDSGSAGSYWAVTDFSGTGISHRPASPPGPMARCGSPMR